MDLTDLTMTLTVVVVLTAVAVLVLYDYLKKQRQRQQMQRIKVTKTAPPQRPTRIFDASPLSYAPAKQPAAAERPLEPQVAIATPSRPPVESRMEREIRSIEMAV